MARSRPQDIPTYTEVTHRTLCHRLIRLVAAFALATLVSALPVARQALAEDTSGLPYEVKLCLDPSRALDASLGPTKALEDAFGFDGTYKESSNLYLETAMRDYQAQGWINRVHLKTGKKTKVELTYKRRYKVVGDDLDGAMARAAADGLVAADTSDAYTAELDWGYDSLTLSFSSKVSLPYDGIDDLSDISEDEIRRIVRDNMVAEEADCVGEGWGTGLVDDALFAGPVRYRKYSGTWRGCKVALEVWPIPDSTGDGTTYICEVSFEGDDHDTATSIRSELISCLDEMQVLLHTDSLKTNVVLDAYLGTSDDVTPEDDGANDTDEDDGATNPGEDTDEEGGDNGSDDGDAGADTADGTDLPAMPRPARRPVLAPVVPPTIPHGIAAPSIRPVTAGDTVPIDRTTADTGAGTAATAGQTVTPTPTTSATATERDASATSPTGIAVAPTPSPVPVATPSQPSAQMPYEASPAAPDSSVARMPLAATSDATGDVPFWLFCLSLTSLGIAIEHKHGRAA